MGPQRPDLKKSQIDQMLKKIWKHPKILKSIGDQHLQTKGRV